MATPFDMVSDGGSSPEDQGRLVRPPSPKRTCPTSLLNHETSDHLLSLRYCQPEIGRIAAKIKPCNAIQFRQSSILRAASGEAGSTSRCALPPLTRNRPRLNAIASSKRSAVPSVPLVGSDRVSASVAMVSWTGVEMSSRRRTTSRAARAQRISNSFEYRALLPSPVGS